MPIAAASQALVRHLRSRLAEADLLGDWSVEAMTLPEARTQPGHGIAFVLWRVQPDEPGRGGVSATAPLRAASKGDPPDGGGLMLRYLLVVRGADSVGEQEMLGRCMAALDRHPVVEDAGDPGDIAAEALVVRIEAPGDETYLRLVEACGDPPPLAVPYLVSSVRLRHGASAEPGSAEPG